MCYFNCSFVFGQPEKDQGCVCVYYQAALSEQLTGRALDIAIGTAAAEPLRFIYSEECKRCHTSLLHQQI